MNPKSNNKVMMIGPDMSGTGGVATVVRGYRDSGMMDRLGIDYYQTHRNGSKGYKLFYFIRSIPMITALMSRYALIHIHLASWWSFRRKCVIIILALLFRKPIILHLHGGKFDIYFKNAHFIEKEIIAWAFSKSKSVIVLSSEQMDKISTLLPCASYSIISNGIVLIPMDEKVRKKKFGDRKSILFMGDLIQRKGVYDLVDAFSVLSEKRNDIDLVLCGKGDMEQLMKRISDLCLVKRISLPGWIDGDEKKKVLEKASLLVLPSYAENIPMCIIEAFANHTPVVASIVGGIPEMVSEGVNGFLIKPGDQEALCVKIDLSLTDVHVWDEMSKQAFQTAEKKFSLDRTEKSMTRIYMKYVCK